MNYKDKWQNIVRGVAKNLLDSYISNNKLLKTHNGPYHDSESEARALAHLIIIAYYEVTRFNNIAYANALTSMGHDLLEYFDDTGLIILRKNNNKDSSNGVIGHAWILEALSHLYLFTKDTIYEKYGNKILDNHLYSKEYGMWIIPTTKKFDYTYNH